MAERGRAAGFLASLAAALLAACAPETRCWRDGECGALERCRFDDPDRSTGTCAPCARSETTYDGRDDDCLDVTPDDDLDRDGFRSSQAVAPGTDCDDGDPAVSPAAAERCGNLSDDDCDGQIDEPDCADIAPPAIEIVHPRFGAAVRGHVEVIVRATDDLGVVGPEVRVSGRVLTALGEPSVDRYRFAFDTRALPDGTYDLVARAADRRLRVVEVESLVYVDNHTEPEVSILEPVGDRGVGGTLTVRAKVVDFGEVRSVDYTLGGRAYAAEIEPYRVDIDTRTLPDGTYALEVVATDDGGSTGSARRFLRVDNSPPSVVIDPPPGSVLRGDVRLQIRASDAGGVPEIRLGTLTSPGPTLSTTLDTRRYPNGPLELSLELADDASVDGSGLGNKLSRTLSYVVDNPELAVAVELSAPPAALAARGFDVRLRAVHRRSDVQLELLVDGVVARTTTESQALHHVGPRANAAPVALELRGTAGGRVLARAERQVEILPGGALVATERAVPAGATGVAFAPTGAELLVAAGRRVEVLEGSTVRLRVEAAAEVDAMVSGDFDGSDGAFDLAILDRRGAGTLIRRGRAGVLAARLPGPLVRLAPLPGLDGGRVATGLWLHAHGRQLALWPASRRTTLLSREVEVVAQDGDDLWTSDGRRLAVLGGDPAEAKSLPGIRRLARSGARVTAYGELGLFVWPAGPFAGPPRAGVGGPFRGPLVLLDLNRDTLRDVVVNRGDRLEVHFAHSQGVLPALEVPGRFTALTVTDRDVDGRDELSAFEVDRRVVVEWRAAP